MEQKKDGVLAFKTPSSHYISQYVKLGKWLRIHDLKCWSNATQTEHCSVLMSNKIDGDAPVMSLITGSILSLDTGETTIVGTDKNLVVSTKYYVFFSFTKK